MCRSPRSTRNCAGAVLGSASRTSDCSMMLAKLFSVSTDYLLGMEPLHTVNVSGLDERDVAILAELADRLRKSKTED